MFIGEQFWRRRCASGIDVRGCNPQQLGYAVQRRFSPWMLSDVHRLVPAKRPCNEALRDEQINCPSLFALMRAFSAKSQRRVKSGMSAVGQPDRASRSPALDVTSLERIRTASDSQKEALRCSSGSLAFSRRGSASVAGHVGRDLPNRGTEGECRAPDGTYDEPGDV